MVLKDAEIYFAEGKVDTAVFTKENVLIDVAAYGLPGYSWETVDRTVFNKKHVKRYGTGYSDMTEVTIKVDFDETNIAQLKVLKEMAKAGKEIAFGYIVDPDMTDVNVKWSGVVTAWNDIDGDATPGTNAVMSFVVKCNTDLEDFTAPAE